MSGRDDERVIPFERVQKDVFSVLILVGWDEVNRFQQVAEIKLLLIKQEEVFHNKVVIFETIKVRVKQDLRDVKKVN